MDVTLDGRYIQDHFPGIGRYAFALGLALAETRPDGDGLTVWWDDSRPNRRYSLAELRARRARVVRLGAPAMSLAEQVVAPWALRRRSGTRSRVGVLHVPHCFRPVWLPVRSVVNVHDVTP